MALVAYATLAEGDAHATAKISAILENAICEPQPQLRKGAFAAGRYLNEASDGVILGVLAGLRDPDPVVSVAAFGTLAIRKNWRLSSAHWRVLIMAAQTMERSGPPAVRRQLASTLVTLADRCPADQREKLGLILDSLRNDICSSVRIAANANHPTGDRG